MQVSYAQILPSEKSQCTERVWLYLWHFREKVARVTGLEPATSGVTGRRSNQLSYTPANAIVIYCGDHDIQKGFTACKHFIMLFA